MNLRDFKTPEERRSALEKETGVELTRIQSALVDHEADIHCENLIGAVSVPLGVAGPLLVAGESVHKEVYVPLATTEGALVASVSRGAKALTECGGAVVRLEHVGTTRGPVFEVKGIEEAMKVKKWLDDHFDEIRVVAEETSSHLKMTKIGSRILGRYLYLRLYFDTQDAMGMNMVTIASDTIVRYISEKTGIHCIAVAGNFDIDKKPAWLNFLSGRGRRGWAEAVISPETLKNVLKSNAKSITEVVKVKCWGGSMMAGSLGFNAHFANITAAFFAATGQDLAHVVEGSLGVTTAEVEEDGSLYFSIYMPDIMIGTVGGGTKLKTQLEARSLLHAESAGELAEIFVAAVLAGELSLIASLAEGSLASVHTRLGR
jgi:hydroxymethylglutaryl-CoA reductase (NADPH)